MIKVKGASKAYGAHVILSDVNFSVDSGCIAGLVGLNGTGKSTLLKLIAGLEEPDTGSIQLPRLANIGYLPQDFDLVTDEKIFDFLRRSVGIDELERRMQELSGLLDIKDRAIDYNVICDQYAGLDGYRFEHRAKTILAGFGMAERIDEPITSLSGGQRAKVCLASILLKGVDVLLLDEPTNNLDLPSLIWLEYFLKHIDAACIIVSHDQRFLDRVAMKIMNIDWHSHELAVSGGSYSDFLEHQEKELKRRQAEFETQQEEITRLGDRAAKKKQWAESATRWVGPDNDKFRRGSKRERASKQAKSAKAIETRIEQIDKVEKPYEREPLTIPLDDDLGIRPREIVLRDLVLGYQESVFRLGPVSISIAYGERIGIVGPNGSGKSTILRAISGELAPIAGTIERDQRYRVGNLTQLHDDLPRNETIISVFKEKAHVSEQVSHRLLSRFGIPYERLGDRLSVLSPGERSRFLLAIFSALQVNLLLLDEPTNHLDLEAITALEEVIETYGGTIVTVSHDRYFLEKLLPDRLILVKNGGISVLPDMDTYEASVIKDVKSMISSLG